MKGLSPRVRGNRPVSQAGVLSSRSIPACAGEPRKEAPNTWLAWVYPRVCGGTYASLYLHSASSGLSPRVRGNLLPPPGDGVGAGSIPACAGEPVACSLRPAARWVYPRVCGGTIDCPPAAVSSLGLSPRVRGNRMPDRICRQDQRSIPACAGEPSDAVRHQASQEVYPRVCGGTHGSHQRRPARPRSIPACAGEP